MHEDDLLSEVSEQAEMIPEADMSEEQPREPEALNVSEDDATQEPFPEETACPDESSQELSEESSAVQTGSPADEVGGSEEPAPEEEADSAVPYHERYYLRYREGKRTTALDLSGTRALLQQLGFDGGELRQAREGKGCFENYRDTDRNGLARCSYCGAEIAGVEFFRLPDGRARCTTCSNTLVKTKAEMEELCQRVISNMSNFFGANIRVPVSIQVVEERKLKKKIGVPLGTKDSQSLLILGAAIDNKQKYSIVLENGAPRISLIATFAHELTHIWQYTYWDRKLDMKKCPKSNRILVYEGMAKWVEIQYLYLIGETNVARREEYFTRNRQDEYGIGFRLYDDRFPLSREAMCCEETPFTPNRYPFD